MRSNTLKSTVVLKLLLAATLIVGLVSFPAHELAPNMPLQQLLWVCAGAVLALFALLVVGAVASLQWSQLILRNGGTDPQWFWFSSEPQGLVLQRQQLADSKTKTD